MKHFLELSSGEDNNSLIMTESFVYRKIAKDKFLYLHALLKKLNQKCLGNFVPTEFNSNQTLNDGEWVLAHSKIQFPSYPHEWCAQMLKDAALFELNLALQLHDQGLFLKDLHPWNVLLDQGRFKHVDVPSLIGYHELPEQVASINFKPDMQQALHHLFNDMLVPYFIYPLLGYAYGKRDWVRSRIHQTSLNASTSIFQFRDLLPSKTIHKGRQFQQFLKCVLKVRQLKKLLSGDLTKDVRLRIESLKSFIESLPVELGTSAYLNYYDEKKENQNFDDLSAMNEKQRHVAEFVQQKDILSVCDVACNTGWFAKLAAHFGKEVVAFDIDEACIEKLYQEVKSQHLKVSPIVASFLNMTPARYSLHNGKKVLIEASTRLKSDCVLALGILHHLVLGEGVELALIVQKLSELSRRYLVLEYIDMEDDKIKNHLEFFPAAHKKQPIQGYDLVNVISHLKKYFDKVWTAPSTPNTRTLILCSKGEAVR